MNSRAVFAGTFDPFTLGHYEIVERASKMFDTLFVAVADDHGKSARYSLNQRLKIVELSLSGLENVKVVTFSGFLVDFMRDNGIKVIVRGLRNSTDFEYERNLFNVYHSQDDTIEGCYLMSGNEFSHISSSLVRRILDLGGDVSKYVKAEAVHEIK